MKAISLYFQDYRPCKKHPVFEYENPSGCYVLCEDPVKHVGKL
jgi:hypothetical protein